MATRRGELIDGILLLDKSEGPSSNQVLQRARRTLNARKAGHAGTLDPFATGLLVCCFGRATKLATQLLESDKTYEATLELGVETDSGDLTGTVVSRAEPGIIEAISRADIDTVLSGFVGDIQQIPPMHSALKHKGKPLYHYARQGVEIERPPRTVTIHDLALLAFDNTCLRIRVQCSKGTYIRTLAQDIGRALGCGAHLSALARTTVGPFSLDQAISLDDLQALPDPRRALIPLDRLPADLKFNS